MGWVQGKNVQPSVIEVVILYLDYSLCTKLLIINSFIFKALKILTQADMAGIPDFDGFKDNINSCSAW